MKNKRILGLNIGGVPEHFNFPWKLAIKEGGFESLGIELHWSDMPGGTGEMIKSLDSGILDAAVVLTEGITKAMLEGLSVKVVAFYVATPLRWGIHVPRDSGITDVSQLNRSTFAVSRIDSGSHLMALFLAQYKGWHLNDMKFRVVGDLYGGLAALEEHLADVFLWEKYTTQPYVEQGRCNFIGEIPTPWPCFVIAVRENVFNAYPELFHAICRVVLDRARELKNDPSSPEIIAHNYGLNAINVANWLNETDWNYDMQYFQEAFEKIIAFWRQHGIDGISNKSLANIRSLFP